MSHELRLSLWCLRTATKNSRRRKQIPQMSAYIKFYELSYVLTSALRPLFKCALFSFRRNKFPITKLNRRRSTSASIKHIKNMNERAYFTHSRAAVAFLDFRIITTCQHRTYRLSSKKKIHASKSLNWYQSAVECDCAIDFNILYYPHTLHCHQAKRRHFTFYKQYHFFHTNKKKLLF